MIPRRWGLLVAAMLTGCASPHPAEPAPSPVRIEARLSPHGIAWSELGSGPPLLMLNGTGSPMAEWDPALLARLASTRRVIVFDYPGLGASTATVRRSFAATANATAQLLNDIGVQRTDVLGWSMGGFVAQELLRRHPDRIHRAVLVGTNPGGPSATLGPRWVQRADSDPHAGVRTYLRTNYPASRCAQRRGQAFITRLNEAVDTGRYPVARVPARTYDAMVAAESPWLRSDRNARALRSVAVPTLVLVGDRDVITPPANSVTLAALLPASTLLRVPASGHSVLFQAPRRSADAISAFLDGQPVLDLKWPCT